ncbi:hypothetical protein [uncultured Sphingomonas sp.]|uniref:phosphoribosyltransferase-like protein n=1 Tax=uncultured Sphingomonas sp. TaxID=158754 RepID=UPI0025FD5D9F|nr:hypothetical protein [uncultured Sphingomonas sp.]
MTEVDAAADTLAGLISDYRGGAFGQPVGDHVRRWIAQFEASVRAQILRELCHVFQHTYLSREKAVAFLSDVIKTKKLAGDDIKAFWTNANLLDVQLAGNSQSDVVSLFGEVLKNEVGIKLGDTGNGNDVFIYLDDGMFTGNRIRRDLEAWIKAAPSPAILHVVVFVTHTGTYYARGELSKAIRASGKTIELHWWRLLELEDRKSETDQSDVLRPIALPSDPLVEAYVENMRYKPHLRNPGGVGKAQLFSSDPARQLLETEFLKAGAKIRADSPYLGDSQRPLGHMSLETLGFGSLFVTYRNCPNNAPLALWAGDPWYPLFPRTTNRAAAVERLFKRGTSPWG